MDGVHDSSAAEPEKPATLGDLGIDLPSVLGVGAHKGLGTRVNKIVGDFSVLRESGVADITSRLRESAFTPAPPIEVPSLESFRVDPSPRETAENTRAMAEAAVAQRDAIAQLVALTDKSLQISEQQWLSNEQSEKFTRRMTWVSVGVAVLSLVASISALVVAIAK